MNPGSTRTFYRARRILVIAACLAPVILLGGAWLVVTRVVMAPPVPTATATADEVVRFLIHPQGLARLGAEQAETVFRTQLGRLATNADLRADFLREFRISSPDEQRAFQEHLFDVFKNIIMADVHEFQSLDPNAQPAYIDARIVEYNRLSRALGKDGISANAGQAILPDEREALAMLLQRTTDNERQMGVAYFGAIQARVLEILADPDLTADFEARIAANNS